MKYYDTRLFWESAEQSENELINNRVEQKQLSLERDWRNKRYKYVDMSESEVVFKSFEEKSEYEKKERLRRSEKEEKLKRRKTESSRERNSNKDI